MDMITSLYLMLIIILIWLSIVAIVTAWLYAKARADIAEYIARDIMKKIEERKKLEKEDCADT